MKCIEDFYQDDEFSRQYPGQKDFVVVRNDQGKLHMQKRMLLVNLKEFVEFKKGMKALKSVFPNFVACVHAGALL